MTSPEPAFQKCTGSCFENVSTPKAVSSDLRSTDSLTVLARIEIVAILVLLLTKVTLCCGMYPAEKNDIF